jgi:perosamine synthetase
MIFFNYKILDSYTELKDPEHKMLERFKSQELIWTGRGATAFLLAFNDIISKAKTNNSPEVILPAISCSTPTNTALLSGLIPRYADVNMDSGLVDLDSIKSLVNQNTVAVVFIHLYGNTADLTEIKNWCDEKNIFLIEDIAHAFGAVLPDQSWAGSVGDYTICSFNKTKIMEFGGGALVSKKPIINCDYKKTWNAIELDNSELKSQLALSYRNIHHGLVSLIRLNKNILIDSWFPEIAKNYKDLYLKSFTLTDKLHSDFNSLEENLSSRIVKANIYSEIFNEFTNHSVLANGNKSGVCWRFSFLLDEMLDQVAISESLRKKGFHVSNLYWSVNTFFRSTDKCPNAEKLARRVVNLWVDNVVDLSQVVNCAKCLKEILKDSSKIKEI